MLITITMCNDDRKCGRKAITWVTTIVKSFYNCTTGVTTLAGTWYEIKSFDLMVYDDQKLRWLAYQSYPFSLLYTIPMPIL